MEFFEEKESNRLHRLTEWAVDCAVMVALACYLVFCFGSRIEMNGSSMKPVLESGDVVLMNRLSYDIGKPNRLDVVVFEREGQQPGIKRIIGLPGGNGPDQKRVHLYQWGTLKGAGRSW